MENLRVTGSKLPRLGVKVRLPNPQTSPSSRRTKVSTLAPGERGWGPQDEVVPGKLIPWKPPQGPLFQGEVGAFVLFE